MTIVHDQRRGWLPILLVLVAALVGGERLLDRAGGPDPAHVVGGSDGGSPVATGDGPAASGSAAVAASDDLERVREAFRDGTSDLWVTLEAPVERVLRDDEEPPRHQRFVLRLAPDLTLLVAHNVDQAPRVPVERGDTVRVHGEYEWNAQGGVLHFTHRRREGTAAGWVEHDGKRYE